MSVSRRILRVGCADYLRNAGIVPIEHANGCKRIVRFRIVVRKRGMKMKNQSVKPRMQSIAAVVWSNVVRQQYLLGITDKQLCEVLGITTRTLCNYRHDPSPITIQQIQSLLDSFGIDMQALIAS